MSQPGSPRSVARHDSLASVDAEPSQSAGDERQLSDAESHVSTVVPQPTVEALIELHIAVGNLAEVITAKQTQCNSERYLTDLLDAFASLNLRSGILTSQIEIAIELTFTDEAAAKDDLAKLTKEASSSRIEYDRNMNLFNQLTVHDVDDDDDDDEDAPPAKRSRA